MRFLARKLASFLHQMKQKVETNGALGYLHRLRMAGYDRLGVRGRCAGHSKGAEASAAALGAIRPQLTNEWEPVSVPGGMRLHASGLACSAEAF